MINNFCSLALEYWSNTPNQPILSNFDSIDVIPHPLVLPSTAQAKSMKVLIKQLDFQIESEVIFSNLFSKSDYSFWLDSAKVEAGLSRYSFIGGGELGPEGYLWFNLEWQYLIPCWTEL